MSDIKSLEEAREKKEETSEKLAGCPGQFGLIDSNWNYYG
jgi:hypothetical protein